MEDTDERITSCQQVYYLADMQFLIWLKHRLIVVACMLLYQSLPCWSCLQEHNGIQHFSVCCYSSGDEFGWLSESYKHDSQLLLA